MIRNEGYWQVSHRFFILFPVILVVVSMIFVSCSCNKCGGRLASDQETANGAGPLAVGDAVPDFSLVESDESTFNLYDIKNQYVVISAFPKATTSVCTKQTCYVSDSHDRFIELGALPVGMSTDDVKTLSDWVEETKYRQKLLSDSNPKGRVSELFGIYNNLLGLSKRANLIISPEHKLVFRKIYRMGEMPDFEEIFTYLSVNKPEDDVGNTPEESKESGLATE